MHNSCICRKMTYTYSLFQALLLSLHLLVAILLQHPGKIYVITTIHHTAWLSFCFNKQSLVTLVLVNVITVWSQSEWRQNFYMVGIIILTVILGPFCKITCCSVSGSPLLLYFLLPHKGGLEIWLMNVSIAWSIEHGTVLWVQCECLSIIRKIYNSVHGFSYPGSSLDTESCLCHPSGEGLTRCFSRRLCQWFFS